MGSGLGERAPRIARLFEAGQGGVHTYRIPALAATTAGTLLAFCEARRESSSDHGDIDLVMRRTCDNGSSWEPARVIVVGRGDTCGNPCPIVVRESGAVVLLFCKNGGRDSEGGIMGGSALPRSVWSTTSRDDGVTWTAPVDISTQARRAEFRWYATGPGHGIQLASGRLLAPCDHATGPGDEHMHSHVIYSDDRGASWHVGGVLGERTDECTAVELADGSVYLNMRSYRGNHRRAVSMSRDGGLTWSAVDADAALIEPVCQASALRVDGGMVVFANPASTRRENLTLRLSRDGCRTWPTARSLWPGPAAYSDLVLCADGSIGCLFECWEKAAYEALAFTRVSLRWLDSA